MVLGSQQSRTGASRSYMFARRRGRWYRRPIVIVIAIVALIAGIYYIKENAGGPNDAHGESRETDSGQSNAALATTNSDNGPGPERETTNAATNSRRETQNSEPARRSPEKLLPDSITMGEATPAAPASESDQRTADTRLNDSNKSDDAEDGREDLTPPLTPRRDVASNTDRDTGSSSARRTSGGVNATPDPQALRLFASAQQLVRENRLIDARETANLALHHEQVGSLAPEIRVFMTELNNTLLFSPTIVSGDPFVGSHKVGSGDRLSKIARDHRVGYNLLASINGLSDPGRIRLGQSVKYIRGPFHAVIDKSEFRMDIYIGKPDSQGRRLYVRSFRVGLGENDSTPVGSWIARRGSKVENPAWTNPRTGQFYERDHPENPIGEYWIGLEGTDASTSSLDQYGIHGTIDPESVGTQASMGCVRLNDDDIALVFEMMAEGYSTVLIRN